MLSWLAEPVNLVLVAVNAAVWYLGVRHGRKEGYAKAIEDTSFVFGPGWCGPETLEKSEIRHDGRRN